jgi:hypothetical protein
VIWHHCRRFGESACTYPANVVRGKLFNFAHFAYSDASSYTQCMASRNLISPPDVEIQSSI